MADEESPQPQSTDPNVSLWTTRLADATRRVLEFRERLRVAKERRVALGGDTPPPETRKMTGGRFPWQTEPNPAYEQWSEADSVVRQLDPVAAGTAKTPTAGAQKAFFDALKEEEEAQAKVASAERAAPTAPPRAVINGVLNERQPDGTWKPVTTTAPPAVAAGEGVDPRLVGKPRGTTIRQETETGLDGNKYTVEYFYGPTGTKQGLASDKDHPPAAVGGAFGTDPTAGIDLQTAQLNLQRAQQQLAAENDPLKKAQLQLAVDQARFTLQQAQAKAPLDLEAALLQVNTARAALAKATSPEAQRLAQIEVAQAELALQQAKQTLNKPSETSRDGYLVRVAPGGEVTRIDTLTPQQRAQQDEVTRLELEKARQGPTFTDATAAYNAQVPRLQQAARTERDRLLELQRSGALSEADAERQFSTWFGQHVEAPLAGYRTAAEEAQRKERLEQQALQRVEDVRAETANRARETVGYQAGEQARLEAIRLAPQGRSPQFLQQYGSAVAGMSARAGAKSAEEAGKLPATARFTADTFDPKTFAGSVPNLDEVARSATQRALAAISPSVAARIGAPLPQLPTGPTLQGMLGQIPYRGPLSGLPTPASGLLPTPGRNQALDLQNGMARTPYGPGGNVYLDWPIPPYTPAG